MVDNSILDRLMSNIDKVNRISNDSDYQELNRKLSIQDKLDISSKKMDNVLKLSEILNDNLSIRSEIGNDLFQLYKSLCYSIINEDYRESSLIQKKIMDLNIEYSL